MHLVVTDLREKYCLNIPAVGPKHGSTKPATATSGALILAVLSALLLMAAHPAHAQTETVLYSFGSQSGDGASPYDTPIMDKEGNLYGTTLTGGTVNWGTVFKVTSSSGRKRALQLSGASPVTGISLTRAWSWTRRATSMARLPATARTAPAQCLRPPQAGKKACSTALGVSSQTGMSLTRA